MRQLALGVGLRILLGVLGAAALVAGVTVAAVEARNAMRASHWLALVLALFGVLVLCGGVLLLQGAWRGRIAVRDPARRASRQ